ncbi:hypothetical protein, partial [Fibrobacter sp. UWR2]|uniref:hypothetical protein n=1 Tax=Fibrobacter sp. UWR2 TaxID=1964352 RepID=UPI001E61E951
NFCQGIKQRTMTQFDLHYRFFRKLGIKLLKNSLSNPQFVSLFVRKKSNLAFSGDEIHKKRRFNPQFLCCTCV